MEQIYLLPEQLEKAQAQITILESDIQNQVETLKHSDSTKVQSKYAEGFDLGHLTETTQLSKLRNQLIDLRNILNQVTVMTLDQYTKDNVWVGSQVFFTLNHSEQLYTTTIAQILDLCPKDTAEHVWNGCKAKTMGQGYCSISSPLGNALIRAKGNTFQYEGPNKKMIAGQIVGVRPCLSIEQNEPKKQL